ncbi:hypothetical protein [Mycolicibacterium komossense]|uniref:Uncharacterized protein n=1 Tax=Mycolicibacterium komossense TaxID=1779 RepID=A0ABT3C992_9MYCO|nr:hypothetical protein [Mycolicibacterium komossense]MCV7226042.1 hypothetical protein [Mycolicibacterium komossense]
MTWRQIDPRSWRRAQLVTFLIAVVWGADYWFTPSGSSALLTTLEGAMPLPVWGSLLIGAGAAGFVAEIALGDEPLFPTAQRARWGWVTNAAHTILFGVYFALASSSLVDVITKDGDGGTYGWRTPALWFGFAWLNAQFVRRVKGNR